MSGRSDKSVYYKAVREKRNILRDRYGGMMSLESLTRELGYSDPKSGRRFIQEHNIPATQVGRGKRYDTDVIAKVLVDGRGMA